MLKPTEQNLLPDYAVYAIANKHAAKSLSDPDKVSIYLEQFVAAIEEALAEAEVRQGVEVISKPICQCGMRGPHLCPSLI